MTHEMVMEKLLVCLRRAKSLASSIEKYLRRLQIWTAIIKNWKDSVFFYVTGTLLL